MAFGIFCSVGNLEIIVAAVCMCVCIVCMYVCVRERKERGSVSSSELDLMVLNL